ncbi:MAG TPA: GNAT family N-acetyltransferase [Dehalococcoidales bacterium]
MINGTKVRLREKRLEDASNDYKWQTDAELSELDAVTPLKMPFDMYLEEYREQLRSPSSARYNYAIETLSGKHIGNCVYYNIDKVKHETEAGIMIGDRDYWNQGYGTDAMTTLVDYLFRHSDFKRLHLKTLEKNIRAQHSFQKCGFAPCGHLERDGYHFLQMELPRSRWQEQHSQHKKRRRLFHFPSL